MVTKIIIIILLFNGEMVLKKYAFNGNVYECLEYGDTLRIKLSIHTWNYKDRGPMSHGWYLKDGSGTFQGFICMTDIFKRWKKV